MKAFLHEITVAAIFAALIGLPFALYFAFVMQP